MTHILKDHCIGQVIHSKKKNVEILWTFHIKSDVAVYQTALFCDPQRVFKIHINIFYANAFYVQLFKRMFASVKTGSTGGNKKKNSILEPFLPIYIFLEMLLVSATIHVLIGRQFNSISKMVQFI